MTLPYAVTPMGMKRQLEAQFRTPVIDKYSFKDHAGNELILDGREVLYLAISIYKVVFREHPALGMLVKYLKGMVKIIWYLTGQL
jgi:hypothetical protein